MNKLIRVCLALVAFAAFAVMPASASAANKVTGTAAGAHLVAGDNIVGKANHSATARLTGPGEEVLVSCTTNELTGTVTNANNGVLKGNITSATFKGKTNITPHTEECTGSSGDTLVTPNPATNGLPWCIEINEETSPTEDTFRVRGNECSKPARPIRFEFHATTPLGTFTCIMERSTAINGTYTTGSAPAKLHISKVEFKQIGGICPVNTGFLDLEMELYKETAGGTLHGVTLDKI